MDTQGLTNNIGVAFVRVIAGAATLTTMNMVSESLKQSGNQKADMIVMGIAATGMVAGTYASGMPSVSGSEYVKAAVTGATTACGLVLMHKVVNMNSMPSVKKDADGKDIPGEVTETELRLKYGLSGASHIPTMTDFGMQSPNVTDNEDSEIYAGVAGLTESSVGL